MTDQPAIAVAPPLPWVSVPWRTSEQVHDLRLANRYSGALDDLAPWMIQFGQGYGRYFAVPIVQPYSSGVFIHWTVIEDTAGWYNAAFDGPWIPTDQGGLLHVSCRLVSGVNNQPVNFTIGGYAGTVIGTGSDVANGSGVDHAAADFVSIRREPMPAFTFMNVTTHDDFTPASDFSSYLAVTQLAFDQ